jgi:hypothetical protein
MYRIVLESSGINANDGFAAARDIKREFAEHRHHHKNADCRFENGKLILTVENDFDPKGLALTNEFSDCISAYIKETSSDSGVIVKSITVVE